MKCFPLAVEKTSVGFLRCRIAVKLSLVFHSEYKATSQPITNPEKRIKIILIHLTTRKKIVLVWFIIKGNSDNNIIMQVR